MILSSEAPFILYTLDPIIQAAPFALNELLS